jgi:hypothetical protein
MSYYYEDPGYDDYSYEYADDGYHDNGDYENDAYSDYGEPDQYEPDHNDHTPSESDPCEYGHGQDIELTEHVDHENGTRAEWETESEGLEYRDDEVPECEPDWEAFEQAEREYGDNGGYAPETEGNEHHLEGSEYEDDDAYEHGTLEYDDAHVSALADHDAVVQRALSDTTYVPTHPNPVYTHPNTHLPAPAPTSPTRATPPVSYERGHVTALNHAQHAPAFNNDQREPAPTNTTSSFPPFLAIFDNNTPPSRTYTPTKFKPHRLSYNHTKADNEAPPPPDFGGGYEEFGMDTETPEPWEFGDTPSKPPFYRDEKGLIREAREGEPGAVSLLLKKWMIVGSRYSEGVQEIWCQREAEHQDHLREREERTRKHAELKRKNEELKHGLPPPVPVAVPPQPSVYPTAPSSALSPLINRNNNNPAKTTTPTRPPPWPIKPTSSPHLVVLSPALTLRTGHNNNYFTSYATTHSRPPPWPIILTLTPIRSTPPARPPPWPILFSDHLQNRWNARRRLRRRSRTLPIA